MLEDLREILTSADRIVVRSDPTNSSETLFESTDKKDLVDLWGSLALEPPTGWFHGMCAGTPALYVYDHGPERVRLTNHHGLSIRCSFPSLDAPNRALQMARDLLPAVQLFRARIHCSISCLVKLIGSGKAPSSFPYWNNKSRTSSVAPVSSSAPSVF